MSYTYDNASRRATMTVGGQAAISYAYDIANRTTQVTLPNNLAMVYGYDNTNQLTGITYKQGATTLGNLTYAYDTAGRRTTVGGTWARTGLPVAATAASITLNANNQALTFAGTTMTYDLNGNLATAQDASGTATYTWDVRNRLTALASPGFSASFAYDALGRRTGKTVQGATTNFVYDGLNPVQEKSGATVTANLLTGLGIDQVFTRTDGAGTRELFSDGLGSTVALADTAGAVQTSYTYEAFGGTTQTGSANTNSYKYTGREDDGTGLYYYRARYYSPRLQRFVSEDPIGFIGGDVNLYGYVADSPVTLIDPYGLASKNYQVGPYDVRIDTGHGSQRHAHVEGPGIREEVQINQDGTPSHQCKESLPKNKRLLEFLRSKGFAVSVAAALLSIIDAAGTSADAATQAFGDAIGQALASPIGGASPAE